MPLYQVTMMVLTDDVETSVEDVIREMAVKVREKGAVIDGWLVHTVIRDVKPGV
jgi:hypothetical protein